jgi:hypothetical protein
VTLGTTNLAEVVEVNESPQAMHIKAKAAFILDNCLIQLNFNFLNL